MIFANVKCNDCGHIFEITKKSVLEDFVIPKCEKCGEKNVHRIWTVAATDIAVGTTGNSKTNYDNSFTYHPSKFGKYKGIRVKK